MVRLMATSSLNTPKHQIKNYAGVIVGDLTSNLVDDIPFDIGGGVTAITARIHTAEAGKVVRMQVADSASSGADANYVHAEVTLANVGWNEVTFDFASPVARYSNTLGGEYTTELSADVVYDEISIFPDWENGLAWDGSPVGTPLTENAIYLIDDVQMAAAIDGGSGSTDEEEEEVVGGGVFDGLAFSADSASTVEAFEGSLSQVIADTTDGAADGNFVVEYTKTPDSKNYAGVIVGDLNE